MNNCLLHNSSVSTWTSSLIWYCCSSPCKGSGRIISVESPKPQKVSIESIFNKPTMSYVYDRQQPIIPTNFNDLNLPLNLFNVITLVSPATVTQTQSYPFATNDSPIHAKSFDIFNFTTSSARVSMVDAWKTSSEVETLYSDEPRWIFIALGSSPTPQPPS